MKNPFLFFLLIGLFLSCTKKGGDHLEIQDPDNNGLFRAKLKNGKVLFEIPDSMLGVDLLLVSRIAQAPANFDPNIAAGSKTNEHVVYWEKKDQRIALRVRTLQTVSSKFDPLHISVMNNNLEPVIFTFDIKSELFGSGSSVIDISPLLLSGSALVSGLNNRLVKKYGIDDFEEDRSWIESVRSFPSNIEIKHLVTYSSSRTPTQNGTASISLLMNQSLIVLPKEKMPVRLRDPRIGWFLLNKTVYSSDVPEAYKREYIERWHLVPKDIEAYQCGELVEPIKPIIFYLDPATPIEWRSYFKQGVEAWNACFETAGFKNAIIAKDPPSKEEDPDFSPEDIKYSVIRYVANTTRNAFGPSVTDPRTGQILESDIMWYHNVLDWLRNRYLIETGAANPNAQKLYLSDEVIGELIKYVVAHEVGHALGLPHNMKASAAYPVDSLRSAHFTKQYGITPTLMDYARFNYIAQPGDGPVDFIAKIGPYDHHAINWGYRYFPDGEETTNRLSAFVQERSNDRIYMFGDQDNDFDPNTQTECLGDDNVKASQYGINNLKIVIDSLVVWTQREETDHDHLQALYEELLLMWYRYHKHVLMNIGGVHETLKNSDQAGDVYVHVPRQTQQQALSFLLNHALTAQDWLTPKAIINRISFEGGLNFVAQWQAQLLEDLLSPERLLRMLENEYQNGQNAFTINNMFGLLNDHIWKELGQNKPLDHTKRILQRNYIDRLAYLYYPGPFEEEIQWKDSDVGSAAKFALEGISQRIKKRAIEHLENSFDDYHYQDILSYVEQILAGPRNIRTTTSLSDQPLGFDLFGSSKDMDFYCY